MYLRSGVFPEAGLRHGFFTRKGGVSTGIFAELNCGGRGSAEPAEIVDENRKRVAAILDIPSNQLLSVHQVHGANVVNVTQSWDTDGRPKADAMVTRIPGFGLGILTADCAPILFADTDSQVIGAAHSGWKGAFAGILEATIVAMEYLGAKRERIVAAIGPTIAQPSYEVDAAFYQRFSHRNAANDRFFTRFDAAGHCRFDLPGFVHEALRQSGIKKVDQLGNDTYSEEEHFFSYRRATHRGEPDYGRQISVISIVES